MDLHRLEVFGQVFEARSFSQAARRLGLTQPTVSIHIKTLEEELGVILFNRLGREVEATDAGRFLYENSRRLLELKQDLLDKMQGFRHRLVGDLDIGASTIPGEYLLPSILVRFHKAHPKVKVRLQIKDSGQIIEDVKAGQVQIGAVGAQLPDPDLEYRELGRDRLVLVAGSDSPWGRRREVQLEELGDIPLLLREEGSGTRLQLERLLEGRGFALDRFSIAAELGSTTAILEGVKAGLGVSFVSDLAIRSDRAAGLLTVLKIPGTELVEREFFLVVHQRRARSPLTEILIEYLSPVEISRAVAGAL